MVARCTVISDLFTGINEVFLMLLNEPLYCVHLLLSLLFQTTILTVPFRNDDKKTDTVCAYFPSSLHGLALYDPAGFFGLEPNRSNCTQRLFCHGG